MPSFTFSSPALLCQPALLQMPLHGKTYIVTGGNSGIGWETVVQLARQGAYVVLACRNVAAGQALVAALGEQNVQERIQVAALDLARLASVRAFASGFLSQHKVLDGLVNNAGVANVPMGRTEDGFEVHFGTNHLGHFLLTELVMPALLAGGQGRVIKVSSCYHDIAYGRVGHLDFDDLFFERRTYRSGEGYAQSKLANVIHARWLARQHGGDGLLTASVHPGWVRTAIVRTAMPLWVQNVALLPIFRLAGMLEPWEGIQTTMHALLTPDLVDNNGAYYSQVGWYRDKSLNPGGWPMRSPNPEVHDDSVAERLDAVSRRLVGLAQ